MQLEQWSVSKKQITFIDEFLDLHKDIIKFGPKTILDSKININKERTKEKVKTIVEIAEPKDSKQIADIFKNLYSNSYPYKRMEDSIEIQKRIEESKTKWTLYKTENGKIVGCFGADLDFGFNKALLHGFAIQRDYHHIIDVLKASIISFLYFWYFYRNQKQSWFGEVRTYSTVPQWGTAMYGLRPIAFLPNKDIFFNKVESEFLHASFKKEMIRGHLHAFFYAGAAVTFIFSGGCDRHRLAKPSVTSDSRKDM